VKALVFLEHHDGALQRDALGVLGLAAELGEADAVVAGEGVSALAGEAGAHGAVHVLVAEDAAFAAPLAQPRVELLASLVEARGYDTVLLANTVLAADVAAGLAARLEAGLNWDLTGLRLDGDALVGTSPALQDSVLVEVGWVGTPRIALVRTGSFEPRRGRGEASSEAISVELSGHATAARMVEQAHAKADGPKLEEAEVIVAGGRGLGAAEGFRLCEELAEALGGAVAATRAGVDAGWYPYAAQVGQTGKTVAPKLYIAAGISGAIQHKVGMQGSQTIVAINKDRHAPIFEFCDFGVVGDVQEVLPRLSELVRQRRNGGG
jgi:electron transfer flavoprotein alpha subunit